MPGKEYSYDQDAQKALAEGAETLAKTIGATLGPAGRNVILESPTAGTITTKDGATVAGSTIPDNARLDLGREQSTAAHIIKQASERVAQMAGDGTSTTALLSWAIYREGMKHSRAGASPVMVKRGIERAGAIAQGAIAELSRPVKTRADLEKIATISAHGDSEAGAMLAQALDRVGRDGAIAIEEGAGLADAVEYQEGMELKAQPLSRQFLPTPEVILENPTILLYDGALRQIEPLLPVLEALAAGTRPFLLIAGDVEAKALATLAINSLKGILPTVALRSPGAHDEEKRELLGDIAALTGAGVLSKMEPLKKEHAKNRAWAGRVDRAIVTKDSTRLIGGSKRRDGLIRRREELESRMESASGLEKELLGQRLGGLAGGSACVKLGARSEAEMQERKGRVEDALRSMRSAAEEGVVPGGGATLIRAQARILEAAQKEENRDIRAGMEAMSRALSEPLRQMVLNAGGDPAIAVDRVQGAAEGETWDVINGRLVEAEEAGILDPAKVARIAVQTSARTAALLLSTAALVTLAQDQEN